MYDRVAVPKSLRSLILSNNELLQRYQAELQSIVLEANEEMMRILGLDAEDGWRLNMDTMEYVRISSNQNDLPSIPGPDEPPEGRED